MMVNLRNHDDLWLNADAAASIDRLEADHGVQPITSAGRTVAEQQRLIDRWDEGGTYNRPPYLYAPKRPAHKGEHVAGNAVDVANHREFARLAAPHGWWQPYEWDIVHFEYDPARDQHRTNEQEIDMDQYVLITYASDDHRNGIVYAGPGYWHKFTAEEYAVAKSLPTVQELPVIVPGNAREYDLYRAIFTG